LTVEELRSIWLRQQDRVQERVAVIERATSALAVDRLDENLRCEAGRAAHMLHGSLGMFGLLVASTAAGGLERELPYAGRECAGHLEALLGQLRRGIDEPVTLRVGD
jgi:chemotaxis protein histidine kinase CheA